MSVALPADFIQRIQQQMPTEAAQLLASLDGEPVISVRAHPLKPFELADTEQVPWHPLGHYLATRPVFTLDPLFHAGCYYPQEASSMFIDHLFRQMEFDDNEPVVLDLCAAPGGKSSLIASFLDGKGLLVANEVIRSRAVILAENLTKWGYGNVLVTQNDPAHFSKLTGVFDAVLVDAPCSGEGMFRKDRVARQEWSLANADLCASRQRRILADIWPTIKEGGYLVYSTCTFNPAENEDNVQWLVSQCDATVVPVPVNDSWGITQVAVGDGVGYAFHPSNIKGEGFFCVLIQKTSHERIFTDHQRKRSSLPKLEVPSGLLKNQSNYQLQEFDNQVVVINRGKCSDVAQLLGSQLKPISMGIALGVNMKKEFTPHHALAMSVDLGDRYNRVELTLMQALTYLKGESINIADAPMGWNIVTYKGVGLGFVKNLGNRVNNYYPKEWRIRMNIPSL
jgi:16S rRNA C967 or C1407 C5-methylase (RsmB/RsmF family)/NOL1/NOP2/fmu family ribosome biogenesis protein